MSAKRCSILCLLLALAFLLTACTQTGLYSATLIFGGDFTISPQGQQQGDVFLIDGSLNIPPRATLEGNVIQVLGAFNLEGKLTGSLYLVGGDLTLGPDGDIEGDVRISGGAPVGLSHTQVGGELIQEPVQVPWRAGWTQTTFNRRAATILLEASLVTFLAWGTQRLFPLQMKQIAAAALQYPLPSAAMGLLVLIVGTSLIVQMIFTILLIPVSILSSGLLIMSIALGWAAIGYQAGVRCRNRLGLSIPEWMTGGAGAFLLILLLNLASLVPIAGSLLSSAAAMVSLGAAFLTRLGTRPFSHAAEEHEKQSGSTSDNAGLRRAG